MDAPDPNVITFEASLPPIGSAIRRHGEGGFRVVLDVPEDHKEAMKRLMDLIEVTLWVVVTPHSG
jgi:diphthamide synthase subunit DPH2